MPQTDKNANLMAISSPNYDRRSMDSAVEYPSHRQPLLETGTGRFRFLIKVDGGWDIQRLNP